ncbi:hypothetical protein FLGE108171_15175 [Flavobacterium gelidilacus]|uniref:hypothetical protein n=1 Tax=Flavobacterium gelidilacus TaxID=206041 RepID=UPI0003F7164F|nr:hypothetical protein [Flavobacterium gelidilacus]
MIQHIKLIMVNKILISLLFLFLSCKNSEHNNINENKIDTVFSTEIIDSSLSNRNENYQVDASDSNRDEIEFDLVSVKQFSNNKPVDSIVSRLNAIKVKMNDKNIFINNISAPYSLDKSDTKKFFGRGYVYDYYVDFLYKNYKIEIKNQVDYVEISYEDAQKHPFKDYFLEGGVTILINDYLFLQYSDYIVTFKKSSKVLSNKKLSIKLPFDYQKYLDECYLIDDSKCDDKYPFYSSKEMQSLSKLINEKISKNNPETIFCIDNDELPFETYIFNIRGNGNQDYLRQTILINIKNNTILGKQIIGISPDADIPDGADATIKSYILNSDLTINIFEIRFGKIQKKIIEKYQIKTDGTIEKIN